MDAEAERDVAIVLSRDVESIRIGELLGIAIGGADDGHDHRVPGDPLVPDLHLLRGHASCALHGTVEAQELLHAGLDQPRIIPQRAELIRMLEEAPRRPLPIRLTVVSSPADEEEHAGGDELPLAELVALFLGRDEGGEEVRLRVLPSGGDEGTKIVGEAEASVPAARDGIGGSAGRMAASRLRAISVDHDLKMSWSAAGTPSISQMTVTGSG